MSLIRRLDTHHKLYASFALLLCLSMGLSLWMLGRLEQMSLLSAGPAEKLSGLAAQAQAGYAGARLLAWVAIGVTVAAAVMLVLWLRAEVARPLHAAAAMARQLSGGDLSGKIGLSAAGDAGELLADMQEMNDSLAGIVARVRAGAESMAGSASQALAGSMALAAHAREQEAMLAQAAAAMAQLNAHATLAQGPAAEQLGQVLASLQQAAGQHTTLLAQAGAAAGATRDQAANLSRITAAFVLGPEHGVALPPIRLVSSNSGPLPETRPADMRTMHAPVRATIALAPAPHSKRSHGAFARRSDWEEF